jgi:hypothetical protein
MMEKLKTIKAWMYARDWRTWIGHGVLGFVFMAAGLLLGYSISAAAWAVLVAFLYREIGDLIGWFFEDKATRLTLHDKLRDGFFDLWAPLAGAAIASIFFG